MIRWEQSQKDFCSGHLLVCHQVQIHQNQHLRNKKISSYRKISWRANLGSPWAFSNSIMTYCTEHWKICAPEFCAFQDSVAVNSPKGPKTLDQIVGNPNLQHKAISMGLYFLSCLQQINCKINTTFFVPKAMNAQTIYDTEKN